MTTDDRQDVSGAQVCWIVTASDGLPSIVASTVGHVIADLYKEINKLRAQVEELERRYG